jgi:PadR family transcriptional regulator, regulatory protein PadR
MANSNMYKGCLEALILKLLQENGRMYGYEITQKAKEVSKGELNITEGALYPLLHRLESEELIHAETENIGNRIRKYYSLTRSGKKQAQQSLEELNQFINTMQLFLKLKLS